MKPLRAIVGGSVAAATLLSMGVLVAPSTAFAVEPSAAQSTGAAYYVDCSAQTNGDGTEASPFNSLTAANAQAAKLNAGEQLLFKRGTTCTSVGEGENKVGLQIIGRHGNDTAGPIVIDAYGDATQAKPKLEGDGVRETVLVENSSYVEVRNLDISNKDAAAADQYQHMRRGIAVINQDQGELRHFVLEGNDIHDVLGEGKKDLGGSGAIQLEVYSSSYLGWDDKNGEWKVQDDNDAAKHTRSWFNETLVANNTVRNVSRSGINMSTDFKCREETAWDGGGVCNANRRELHPWTPSRNLIIRNNHLEHVGGDGIVAQMTDGAVVEGNYLAWAAEKALSNNAGIWNWNADNTLFQYNEVTNTQKIGNNDGTAWDFDYGTRNTVFQYNYSHDNAGGSMLFCGCGSWKSAGLGWATGATFRYNISVNDGYADELADGSGDTGRLMFLAGATDASFYNNTFVMPADQGKGLKLTDGGGDSTSVLFANNLFISDGAVKDENGKLDSTVSGNPHLNWKNNVFVGPASGWPAPTENGNRLVDLAAFLADANTTMKNLRSGDLSKLDIDSTYLAGAGAPIAHEGVRDFFDRAVPAYGNPDVGAIQRTGVDAAETTAQKAAAIAVTDSATFSVPANATIKVSGTVSNGNELVLRRGNDWYSFKQELGYATADGTKQTGYVRMSNDGGTLDVICQPKDSKNAAGQCTDVTVTTAVDDMIDGSFEATGGSPWSISGFVDGSDTRIDFDNFNAKGDDKKYLVADGKLRGKIPSFESRTHESGSVAAGEYAGFLGSTTPAAGSSDATFFVDTLNQRNIPAEPGATYTLGFWTVLGKSKDDTAPQVTATVKYRKAGSGTGADFDQYQDLGDSPVVFRTAETDANGKAVKSGAKVFVTGTFTVPADAAPEGNLWLSVAQPNLAADGTAAVDDITLVKADAAPKVTVGSLNTAAKEGQTIAAYATVNGAQPGVTYLWQKQQADGSWKDVQTVTGTAVGTGLAERSRWLSVPNAAKSDAGTYRVVVTAADGQTASATVNVTVADGVRTPADKAALKVALDAAAKLDEKAYTADSWKTLSDAVTAGQKVYNDANAGQKDVDDAAAAVLSAIDGLVAKVPGNKAALQALVDAVAAIDQSQYTDDSAKALADALAAAKAVLDDQYATQDEIDAAVATLTAARDGLVAKPVPAVKTALQAAYDAAAALDLTLYTDDSAAAVKAALAAAKVVLGDESATQAQVDAALTELNEAVKGLVAKPVPAVKTALQAAYDTVSKVDLTLYTDDSAAAVKAALAAAKVVLGDGSATQAQVDAATKTLLDAYAALVAKPIAADTKALAAEVEASEKLSEKQYTADSWKPFAKALAEAQALLKDSSKATQAEVDAAWQKLYDARLALVAAVPSNPKPQPDPNKPGDGDGQGRPGDGDGQPGAGDRNDGGSAVKPGAGSGESQTPGRAQGGSGLSKTGASVAGVAVAAVLLLAAGVAVTLRRRRA
ncbi:right-handed parallel beta-helix repeat-containing protein [Bifidobacterium leontopitheci]|uniref:FIVAR domain-containing protein n=1 Tax=Bifidobacterium leontopitheci TaxID=2650774 RepID=A0A6I1GV85_9BIFI|nr:right-handed parallel beta-helix repeat-containing protein [Bifidobacterium leontopitheci]KAB7790371.1 FIVAR domain-containing protein [Bifidobacterium leontopitheci]